MTNPYPSDSHWPADFEGCTLTGTWVGLDGAPIAGFLTLTASPVALADYASFKTVVPRGLRVDLDANGHASILVPATDDPDISPLFWTYKVVENWSGGRTYNVEAPQNQTVDLVNAAPAPSSAGTPIVRGPTGVSVADLYLSGATLMATMSDGSTITVGVLDVDGGDPSGTGDGEIDGGGP